MLHLSAQPYAQQTSSRTLLCGGKLKLGAVGRVSGGDAGANAEHV